MREGGPSRVELTGELFLYQLANSETTKNDATMKDSLRVESSAILSQELGSTRWVNSAIVQRSEAGASAGRRQHPYSAYLCKWDLAPGHWQSPSSTATCIIGLQVSYFWRRADAVDSNLGKKKLISKLCRYFGID
jgi:hypothetical protein